jgi:hypothetical protein
MSQGHAPTPLIVSHDLHSGANTRIPKRWLWVARIALLAISVLALVVYIAGTPANLAWFDSFHPDCLDVCMTPATVQSLHALSIPITTFAIYWTSVNLLFALTYFVVAALIFWRKSDDRVAWLASFSLVTLGAAFPSIPAALADVHPAWWLPVTIIGNENLFGFPSLIIFFFLFPNGRFVPRWTRWVAVGFAAVFVFAGFFPGSSFSFSNWLGLLFVLVPLVIFGSLVFAQVYRYRRISTPVERQQTKWIVFGAAVALLGFLLLGFLLPAFLRLFMPLQSIGLLPTAILVTSIYLVFLLIPLSIAIAILRYRLWDVDVLINKTLVYSLLTGTLLAVYAGCIVGLQALLRGLFHQTSDVAIVASTLFIAALFQPLRKGIQAIIDRRFYRRKYDAARTVEAFSATLRNEVDLNQVCEDLIAVVQETMQPAHISLWLRKPEQAAGRNTRLLPHIDEGESTVQ